MKQKIEHTGLIKPFNMDLADYESMYRGNLPNGIIVSINTLTSESVTYAEIYDLNMRVGDLSAPQDILRFSPCPIKEIVHCAHPRVLTPEIESVLTVEQRAWMVNGRYHQLSFHVELDEGFERVHEGTGVAMTFLDWWHCVSKSFDPSLHLPQTFSKDVDDHHNNLVGDLYQTGTATWNEALIKLRNELLIVYRAADTGQNIFQALADFRSSGRQSFLW